MTLAPIRIAIVGMGLRGVDLARTFGQDVRYTISALCDINIGKLHQIQLALGLTRIPAYTNIARLLQQEDPDAVVVAVPDGCHAAAAVPALEAGKRVFLEKPLEITATRCQEIIAADDAAGGKTFVGFNLRFSPLYAEIRRLLDNRAIGDILTIQADEFYDGGRTYFRRWNRRRADSGGLWITKACHDFDLLCWFAGCPPLAVSASAALSHYVPRSDAAIYCGDCPVAASCPDNYANFRGPFGSLAALVFEAAAANGGPRPDLCLYNSDKDTFDHGMAIVEFGQNTIATYTCNVVAGFTDRRIRISGTAGTIDGALSESRIIVRQRDPSSVRALPLPNNSGAFGGADELVLDGFYQFVRGQTGPSIPPRQAFLSVLTGIAATRSSDERRRVLLSEVWPG